MEVIVQLTLKSASNYYKQNSNKINDKNKVIASLLVQLINSNNLNSMESSDFAQISSLIRDKVDTEQMRKLTELLVSLVNSGIEFKKNITTFSNKEKEIETKPSMSELESKTWASIAAKPPPIQPDTPRPKQNITISDPCTRFNIDPSTYASGIELGKYKIIRCKHEFNGKGKCEHGSKCDFAHSIEELNWFLEFQKNKEEDDDDYALSDSEA